MEIPASFVFSKADSLPCMMDSFSTSRKLKVKEENERRRSKTSTQMSNLETSSVKLGVALSVCSI